MENKKVFFVYFGSEDAFDLLTEKQYFELVKRLKEVPADTLPALPLCHAGNKLVRLQAKENVLRSDEEVKFKPTRSRKANLISEDHTFLKEARKQLSEARSLPGRKTGFVLLPFCFKVERSR